MNTEVIASILEYFEVVEKDSELFPIRKKLDEKRKEFSKLKLDDPKATRLQQVISALQTQLVKQRELSLLTEIPAWFDNVAQDGLNCKKRMAKVTHSTKFSHPENEYSGICVEPAQGGDYLSTDNSGFNEYEISYSNGALIRIALFFHVNFSGKTVFERLISNDFEWLNCFSNSTEKVHEWGQGLACWLCEHDLKAIEKMKQLYFPVSGDEYHLLSPMTSSSLAHELFKKINNSKWSESSKKGRLAKSKSLYSELAVTEFPKLATTFFGGAHPRNISLLNHLRSGKAYLLNCAPPSWQSTLKPPLNDQSIFSGREFNRRVWRDLQELQSYLLSIKGRDSTLEIRRNIAAYVNDLIDGLLNYAAEVQGLSEHAGWSLQNCELKLAEKLWLDPWCEDLLFQQKRANHNWQQDICLAFAGWLNSKLNKALKNDGLVFGTVQYQHWAKLLSPRLRDFELGTMVFSAGKAKAEAAV
jgi:CRISPR-associated protein Csy1